MRGVYVCVCVMYVCFYLCFIGYVCVRDVCVCMCSAINNISCLLGQMADPVQFG